MDSDNVNNIRQSASSYVRKHYWGYLILFGVGAIGIVVYIKLYGVFDILSLFIPVIFFAMGYVYLWNVAYQRLQHTLMQQFAQMIGYNYTPTLDIKTLDAKIFTLENRSGRVFDVMTGMYQSRPVRIFTFEFSIPEGRSSIRISYTVLEVTVENSLPNIILNSKDKNFIPRAVYKPNSSEHVMLEGDFNNYFSLYVPTGYEVNAYTIFSPDKMVTLIDKAKNFSFEFNGKHVYIYTDQQIETKEEMQNFFDFSDYLYSTFGHALEISSV